MPSIFERPPAPPLIGPEALDNDQAARSAALFVVTQAHPGVTAAEHVAMASYVIQGPGGYVGFYMAWDDTDDIDVTVVNDTNVGGGRTVYDSGIGDE